MKTKGIVLKGIKEYIKENYSDKYDQWMQSLNDESRTLLNSKIQTGNMYSVDILNEISIKAANVLGMDINELSFNNSQYSVEMALKGFLKIVSTVSSISFLLNRSSTFIKSYYDFIEVKKIKQGHNFINYLIIGVPEKYEFILWRIYAWIYKVIGLKTKKINAHHLKILDKSQNNILRAEVYIEYTL